MELCEEAEHIGSWSEQCPCHSECTPAGEAFRAQVRARKARLRKMGNPRGFMSEHDCPYKVCRAVEFASGAALYLYKQNRYICTSYYLVIKPYKSKFVSKTLRSETANSLKGGVSGLSTPVPSEDEIGAEDSCRCPRPRFHGIERTAEQASIYNLIRIILQMLL